MQKALVFTLLVFCLLIPKQAQALVLKEVAVEEDGRRANVTLKFDSPPEYKFFTLDNPERAVFDVESARWNVVKVPELDKNKGGPLIAVRHGEPQANIMRVVLDLDPKAYVASEPKFTIGQGTNYQIEISLEVPEKNEGEEMAPVPLSERITIEEKKSHLNSVDESKLPASMRGTYRKLIAEQQEEIESGSVTSSEKNASKTDKALKHHHKPVVVIDPGHGGVDPGAISKSVGAYEKRVTLKYAKALKSELEKSGKYKVILTRTGDYYVNLYDRVKIARKAGADLFISIHADSHPDSDTSGLSVYTISEQRSKREGDKLAKKADREEVVRGLDMSDQSDDVQRVLIDMAQRDNKNTSARFADILVKNMGTEAKLLENTHRFGGFAVLTGVDVPSVLVELGYLSNPREAKLLITESYQNRMVGAMKDAIESYFIRYPIEKQ